MNFLKSLKIQCKIFYFVLTKLIAKGSCIGFMMVFVVLFLTTQNSYGIKNPGARTADWMNGDGPREIEGSLTYSKLDNSAMRRQNDKIDRESGSRSYGETMKEKKGIYHCVVDFPKFDPSPSGPDTSWEIGKLNPACLGYIGGAYLVSKIATKFAATQCRNFAASALMSESTSLGGAFTPAEAALIVKNAGQCAILEMPTKALCCSAVVASGIASATAITVLRTTIYKSALDAHQYARICGRNWESWSNPKDANNNDIKNVWVKGKEGHWIDDARKPVPSLASGKYTYDHFEGSYAKYLAEKAAKREIPFNLTNMEFRELVYDGIEYEANPSTSHTTPCNNPWDLNARQEKLGYNSQYQRYYMRGSGNESNYACERFLGSNAEERKQGREAFECCVEKSKKSICIESASSLPGPLGTYEYKFCELGSTRCKVKNIFYDIRNAQKNLDFICAQTFNACPFNHLLGGGTEEALKDNGGNLINHCQYLKHCVKVSKDPYIYDPKFSSAFISGSCRDLKGDSQNTFAFDSVVIGKNNRNFSAPMAQCLHETLRNVFLNKVGHTICIKSDEIPDKLTGRCPGGQIQLEGSNIAGASFFETIQENLKYVIKGVLTLAIMVIGYTILMGGEIIARKDLSMFIIKLALVMYFALGTAWQQTFFEGVFEAPVILSRIFTRIDEKSIDITAISKANPIELTLENTEEITSGSNIKIHYLPEIPELNDKIVKVKEVLTNNRITLQTVESTDIDGRNFADYEEHASIPIESKLDGCQFPKFDYSLAESDPNRFNNPRYPPGKEYLEIWDILDCKIVNAIGLTPGATVPAIFMTMLSGLLTFGFGIVFALSALIFVFYLISITVRALHMFVTSTIAIVLLIYISPVMITLSLFKKTNPLFKKWWSNLLGFVIQPLILFAYLGILITIFNQVVVGDLNYIGDGTNEIKQADCKNSPGGNDSLYCIFEEFEIIGTGVAELGLKFPQLGLKHVQRIGRVVFNGAGRVGSPETTKAQIDELTPEVKEASAEFGSAVVGTFGRPGEIMGIMMKAAFFMFIFSQFFGKISTLAAVLVGSASVSEATGAVVGSQTGGQGIKVGKTTMSVMKGVRGLQKRGFRGAIKLANARKSPGAKRVARFIGKNLNPMDNGNSKPPS